MVWPESLSCAFVFEILQIGIKDKINEYRKKLIDQLSLPII